MPTWADNPLVLIAVGCAGAGIVLYGLALHRSRASARAGERPAKDMSDVLLALGNAVLVSGALTLAIFLVQQKFVEQRDRETRLLMTADLSGYDPGPNSADRGALVNNRSECVERPAVVAERVFLRARYLASKRLNGARLGGLNLERTEFRDSALHGAILRCSKLVEANLQHTDLSAADLRGADITKADFRSASLDRASLPSDARAWAGVKVNAQTCWPVTVTRRWITSLPVIPYAMRTEGVGKSYGHLCGRGEPILVAGAAMEGDLPRANGEAVPVAAATAKLDDASIQTLSGALQQAIAEALAPVPTVAAAATATPVPPTATVAATP